MPADQGLLARVVRALGFAKKEVVSLTRQHRLILTLIVTPFAILLIFGIGYRTQPPPFDTLLVLPGEEAGLAAEKESLSQAFGSSIDLKGTTTNATEARAALRRGDVDLLIIGPADALQALEEGEHAEFVVVHSEVDPLIRSSITLLAQISVDELNRRILQDVVSRAQTESEEIADPLADLRTASEALVSALESGDQLGAERAQDRLSDELTELEGRATSSTNLYATVAAALGMSSGAAFDSLRAQVDSTTSGPDGLETARELEASLDEMESRLNRAQETDPRLLVSPFAANVQDIADLPRTPSLFYAPGALIVLLQHLAVTFAALSVVRERQLGLTELFRASPLAPGEILIGKYAAFLSAATALAAILTLTMLPFGVTLRGSPLYYSVTVLLVIVASLGLGFMLSGVAKTDTEVVQYSMMILLFSIFFTGLILPLEQLVQPIKAVSYLVPGTYGISALHDVMFRGLNPNPLIIGGLVLYSAVVAVFSWWVVNRDVGEVRP